MELDTIHWYPGHMVKARRMVQENLKLVDVVVELLDARIPVSSRNPVIDDILADKLRIVVLNKSDLAEKEQTDKWRAHFIGEGGYPCVIIDAQSGKGVSTLVEKAQESAEDIIAKIVAKGRNPRPVRLMMVGIPNVGKSSLINKLAGKGSTKTGDRPGLTRGKQWIRVARGLELLDTPGILWPKFEDPEVGFKLAVTGAIKDEIINVEQVVTKLLIFLSEYAGEALKARYKLEALDADPVVILENIGRRRGCLVSGGKVDTLKAATIILSEFRDGRLGNFTLDRL